MMPIDPKQLNPAGDGGISRASGAGKESADAGSAGKASANPQGSRVSVDKHLADMNALAMARGARFGAQVSQGTSVPVGTSDGSAAVHGARDLIERDLSASELRALMRAFDHAEQAADLASVRDTLGLISAGRLPGFAAKSGVDKLRAAFADESGGFNPDEALADLGLEDLQGPIAGLKARGPIDEIPSEVFADAIRRGSTKLPERLIALGAKPGDPADKLVAALAKLSSGNG